MIAGIHAPVTPKKRNPILKNPTNAPTVPTTLHITLLLIVYAPLSHIRKKEEGEVFTRWIPACFNLPQVLPRHLSQFSADPSARHAVYRTISLFRRAVASSGMVLRTLVGRTRVGLCLPSACAPIISRLGTVVKGFEKIFFVPPSRRLAFALLTRDVRAGFPIQSGFTTPFRISIIT